MASYVVDVNVVVKWRVPEALAAEAALLLGRDDVELFAPEFLLIEANNVFATKVRAGEISPEIARNYLASLPGLLDLAHDAPLLDPAFALSSSLGASVYDALYVALALREGHQFVTADEKLLKLLGPLYPETLLWLGDVTSGTV